MILFINLILHLLVLVMWTDLIDSILFSSDVLDANALSLLPWFVTGYTDAEGTFPFSIF